METAVANRLLRLNREFYDRFADSFTESRTALNPGIRRAMELLPGGSRLLDVGCGNGRVLQGLLRRGAEERLAEYVGVDFSERLLGLARGHETAARWVKADLSAAGWPRHSALRGRRFDCALCLAVLHHIPGPRRRLRLLREIHGLLRPRGRMVLSVWQFLHLERMRRKIVPFSTIGLTGRAVERGDLLIDWNRCGRGLRYVHHFEPGEVERLCARAGFIVRGSYRDDGRSGDMSLYLVCDR